MEQCFSFIKISQQYFQLITSAQANRLLLLGKKETKSAFASDYSAGLTSKLLGKKET
jgi:hypothetical protein